jgi:ABC-type sugar transport system substrate-binding protein
MRRWFVFPKRILKRLTLLTAARLRGIPGRAVLLIVAAWASVGCDSFSFVPPQPEELRGSGSAISVATTDGSRALPGSEIALAPTKSIEFVLGPHGPDESEVWKSSARTQAGNDTVKLKIVGPAEPPATQADLVRAALANDPRVLVIEFTGQGDRSLLQTIEEAQGKGIPVVVLGRPPSGADSTKGTPGESKTTSTGSSAHPGRIVYVTPPPFSASAKQLVASAIRHAQYAELDTGKTAILLVNAEADSFAVERVLAIKEALQAAGITAIEEVRFGNEPGEAEKAFSASLAAHPKTVLVFAVDPVGCSAIRTEVKNDTTTHRFFVASCYADEGQGAALQTGVLHVAAVAEFSPTRLMRKAITTAAALAQGRDVPRVVELRINVVDSLASPAVIKVEASQWKKAREAAEKAKK